MNKTTTAVEELLNKTRTLAQTLARSASARNVVPQFCLRHICVYRVVRTINTVIKVSTIENIITQ